MNTFWEKLSWWLAHRDINKILKELGDKQNEIRRLSKDDLWKMHRGLGLNLRISFRNGRYRFLFRYSTMVLRSRGKSTGFDDISGVACEKIWEELQS
jgi:hypothetical protein